MAARGTLLLLLLVNNALKYVKILEGTGITIKFFNLSF